MPYIYSPSLMTFKNVKGSVGKNETYLTIFSDMNLSRTKIGQFKSLEHVPAMWITLVQGYDCTIILSKLF